MMTETLSQEALSMSQDMNPSMLDGKDLTVSTSAGLEQHLSRLDNTQRQKSQLIEINRAKRRSDLDITYTISKDNLNPATLHDVDSSSIASVELEQKSSGLATSQSDPNPLSLNDTYLSGVTWVNLKQQSLGFDKPQRQKGPSSRLDASQISSFATNYTSNSNDTNRLKFNGANSTDVSISQLVHLQKESFGLDTSQRYLSQSSRMVVKRRSGSMTNHTTTIDDTNLLRHIGTDLTGTALKEARHHFVGLNASERQDGHPSTFDSTTKQEVLSSESDVAQNLKTRGTQPAAEGKLGSVSNDPLSMFTKSSGDWQRQRPETGKGFNSETDIRIQEEGRPKKIDPDFVKCYGKWNGESIRRGLNKIRHYSAETKDKIISSDRTKSTGFSEGFNKGQSMSGLKGALQKIRQCNCVQSVLVAGKKRGMDPEGQEWTDFEQECLEAHNEYRARHGVPKLKLNRKLCQSSQRYADTLAATDPQENMKHSRLGENLCATRGHVVTGRSAVDDWYAEISNYDFHTAWAKDETKEFTHFTEIVWRKITDMGVGYATSASDVTYVVCHYNPPGNNLKKFRENVPPPHYGSNLHN